MEEKEKEGRKEAVEINVVHSGLYEINIVIIIIIIKIIIIIITMVIKCC